ncbi:S1C family serine protease [Paenisporosarcina cavernae]|uniref:PDZ domain-containing protein n=1 Tax=Paenisporosarcina cavernae TaxID=2320858 RepID=A0A385YQY4_9BACL|nr:trypsin-like peptidase domain-containing protein [Paenisporosarcina cavernae]AYC28407.1 PDZ domain-containing protein [Paenisporosarcina cavernae]
MGYYDNHTPGTEQVRVVNKGSKAGYFFTGLIGVLIGALIVWMLVPSLGNVMPGNTGVLKSTNAKQESVQLSADITTDVTTAVETAKDAVVGVTNLQSSRDIFNPSSEAQAAGTGSGVIYKKSDGKAYVVTNNHVVQDSDQLEVTLSDGTKIEAKLLGTDIWTDLAVLEMDAKNVKSVIEFGDSESLKQGETVIAIGNPLGLEFSGSVTTGVVSGKDRAIPVDLNGDNQIDWQAEVLQTDAAINPGNSGGALVNLAGQLVGINSMKIAQNEVEGMGLAIPVDSAIPIIEDLESFGEVKRPTMGVTLVDVMNVSAMAQREVLQLPEEVKSGVVIDQVVEGSPAGKAGLKQYDVIVEMDGEKIEDSIALRKHLYSDKEVGDNMTMKIYRKGELMEVELKLTDNTAL